jgi:homoserine dehydrogenase
MKHCTVALCGCGTVGLGVAEALLGAGALADRLGDCIRLRYVVDLRADELRTELAAPDGVVFTNDLDVPLQDPDVDVVVELIGGVTVARDLTQRALAAGKDVVTANKALLAEHGDALYRTAREHGRSIAFGAAVAGCIPVIAALRSGLVGDTIESVYGIVNGTCNYVLTRMLGSGMTYDDALAEAQQKGYAEADPTLDVDGHDSAHKLAVLARLAFGLNIPLDEIPCEGISSVDLCDLQYADQLGYTLKLLAIGVRRDEQVALRVHPALLHHEHPMAGVGDAFNAVCLHGSMSGEVVLTGRGAGRYPTASAVVADIARVAMGTYQTEFAGLSQFGAVPDAKLVPFGRMQMRYYLRLHCHDEPGVMAMVARALADEGISIASVRQHEPASDASEYVPVIFMTHQAEEAAMRRALVTINDHASICAERTRMFRVADI